jgi:multisubunit Na+/H+ antiporter MnhE subunit
MNARVDKSRQGLGRRRAVIALSLLSWWVLLAALWMLIVDTISLAEVIGAAVAALAAVLLTRLASEVERPAVRFGLGTARRTARQALRVPADLLLLFRELPFALVGKHRAGRFHEIELELPLDARGNARRAATELFGSLAPNTIVLGVDERRVIVHQLVARHRQRTSVGEIGS